MLAGIHTWSLAIGEPALDQGIERLAGEPDAVHAALTSWLRAERLHLGWRLA